MDSGTRFEIDLPPELAEVVRERVASGRYTSESEMFAEGVLRLVEGEESVFSDPQADAQLAAGYDAWKANPTAVYTLEEVEEHLREERARYSK